RVILHVRDTIRTGVNIFGLLREYLHRPSFDPDATVTPEELADSRRLRPAVPVAETTSPPLDLPPYPFRNMTVWRLMHWLNTGSGMKSQGEADRLVNEVILADDFHADELTGFRAATESRKLDNVEQGPLSTESSSKDGWVTAAVNIDIPTGEKASPSRTFTVPGLRFRPLVGVIQAAFSEPLSRHFHLFPFKRFWHPVDSPDHEQRVYDELYTCDAFLKAHDELQKQPPEPDCHLERVVAALMFWSDSTHLASFGTAKAWPIYLFFGNLSKYVRAKPRAASCHHIAYIP
ncbi:hypothetical protein B0H21DRAFT_657575, partial [Amylocystis lapponica]